MSKAYETIKTETPLEVQVRVLKDLLKVERTEIYNLKQQLAIQRVSQQRELLFSFIKKYNSGNTHSSQDIKDFEVNDFLENYSG